MSGVRTITEMDNFLFEEFAQDKIDHDIAMLMEHDQEVKRCLTKSRKTITKSKKTKLKDGNAK